MYLVENVLFQNRRFFILYLEINCRTLPSEIPLPVEEHDISAIRGYGLIYKPQTLETNRLSSPFSSLLFSSFAISQNTLTDQIIQIN